jgi:hypothetical protein
VRAVSGRWCSARAASNCAAKSLAPFGAAIGSPAVVRAGTVTRVEGHCSGDVERHNDGPYRFRSDH